MQINRASNSSCQHGFALLNVASAIKALSQVGKLTNFKCWDSKIIITWCSINSAIM